jgi:uncharacterized RDD family membrane protein YckC
MIMDKKVLRVAFIGERFLSMCIDNFIIIFVFFLLVMVSSLLGIDLGLICTLLIIIMYLCKDIFGGQTVGKRFLGIAIRDASDLRNGVNVSKLILRNITFFIIPIDFFFMLLNKDNQRLGDRIAGTTVVKLTKDENHNEDVVIENYKAFSLKKEKSLKSKIKIIIIIFIVFILFICSIITIVIATMKNSGAYKEATYQIKNNPAIIKQVGEVKGFGFMPTGSISTVNGVGEAELNIDVKGKIRDINVYVKLHKNSHEKWIIEDLEIVK